MQEESLKQESIFDNIEPRFRPRGQMAQENVALSLVQMILLYAIEMNANLVEIKRINPYKGFQARFFRDSEMRGELAAPYYDKIKEYLTAKQETQIVVNQLLQDFLEIHEAPQDFLDVFSANSEKFCELNIKLIDKEFIELRLQSNNS